MGKTGKSSARLSLFEKLLRRRVQKTYDDSTPSIDELIDGLRAKYREYDRHKPQLFTRMVKQTLDSNYNNKDKRKSSRNDDEDKASSSPRSPVSKKVKKIDSREHRLHMSETEHVARRRIESQSTSSESESSFEDGEEDISAVLTSDDEVYNLKFEPEFNPTKSMLRNKHDGSKIDAKCGEKPKNVELEMVTITNSNNKERKKVYLVMEDNTVKPVVKASEVPLVTYVLNKCEEFKYDAINSCT